MLLVTSDWLMLPEVDSAAGTVTVSLGGAAILGALLLLLLFLAMFRAGWHSAMASVVRVSLVLVGVAAVWAVLDRMAQRDQADERRALDQRILEMTARATAPGSPLGCLEPNLGELIDAACEKAVFAGPETIAAATAYVAASLSLLADGLANGVDPNFDTAFAALRRRIESDRFGLVAQVLATREGCTATNCEKLALLADSRRVSANLQQRTFGTLLARYVAAWSQPERPAAPVAAAPAAPPAMALRPPAGPGINFPSAASIPPVSIMTNEPTEPPAQAAPAPASTPSPPKRPPAPGHAAPRAQAAPAAPAQATPVAPPVQLAPPAATAGPQPNPQ
jgi:hypothetical protein